VPLAHAKLTSAGRIIVDRMRGARIIDGGMLIVPLFRGIALVAGERTADTNGMIAWQHACDIRGHLRSWVPLGVAQEE
jgi:hypothetical protein